MKLAALIATRSSIPLTRLSDDRELSVDVQNELIRLGILDPPADGIFGSASMLAIREFCLAAGLGTPANLDEAVASTLAGTAEETLFPVDPGDKLAGAIWSAMKEKKYWVARVPGYVNIVYLEGANSDGSANDNKPNGFNDLRTVAMVQGGKFSIQGRWEGTTEPGKFYTERPMVARGAARIAFGQYKAWTVGTHGSATGAHEALVQSGEIRVHRDLNRDYMRDNDAVETGSSFAINQHWGYDLPVQDIGNASAGCLVGRTREGHKKFMSILKQDPRYKRNNGYRFLTTILSTEDIRPFL